jgi:hypothetical protein
MTKTELRNKYKALRAAGRFHGTIKRALELRQQREANPPRTRAELCLRMPRIREYYRHIMWLNRGTVVPIGRPLSEELLAAAKRENPHLRNWKAGVDETGDLGNARGWYSIRSSGSNSDRRKRSTFQRGIWVRSVFQATTRRLGTMSCGPYRQQVQAPRGWMFQVDANGVFLRRNKPLRGIGLCDYHFTASEILRMPMRELTALAVANAKARKREQDQRANWWEHVEKAEREGATVCLADSLRAGNCWAGTVSWARRAGLWPGKHYAPSEIAKRAGNQLQRVTLVIRQALRRHYLEMDRGYANLSDHRS